MGEMENSMRKKFVQIAAVCLLAGVALALGPGASPTADAASQGEETIRVGLYYGSSAMDGANLANEVGEGFRFGYFDEDEQFVSLAYSEDTSISIVKTTNVYYGTSGGYTSYHESNTGSDIVVGCYHIQLPGEYTTFENALVAASVYDGGFVAYIDGTYYARVGNFTDRAGAEAAQEELAAQGVTAAIRGTSAYGISVVDTGTNTILFQYDDSDNSALFGVAPNAAGETGEKFETWFRGYTKYGTFRYERVNGGDLTIVNILGLEDYVKGVVPYEMSDSWPIEALKAQAVCARTYALANLNRHSSYGFDICSSTHCQAYYGTNRAGSNSDSAVDQTAGLVATYNGRLAECYYYSSNGGTSEDVSVVWGSDQSRYPYLVGVVDPYEALVVDQISNYEWSYEYTGEELAAELSQMEYTWATDIVAVTVTEYSRMGNPAYIQFTDASGLVTPDISTGALVRNLGLRSYHYTITGGGSSGGQLMVNGQPVDGLDGLYAIGGDGNISAIGGGAYVIDGNGDIVQAGSGGGSSSSDGVFTISGAGWGHNVGMSQWGAYAQAQEGRTYLQILTFYYTGITVERFENI